MSIGARVRQVRQIAGLTLRDFGDRIGLTASTLSSLENGKSNASTQALRSIAREFNVSEDWLRTGEGDMAQPPDRSAELGALVGDLFRDRPDSFRRMLITTLLRMRPDGPEWALLEKIVSDIQAEAASTQAIQQDTPQNLGESAPIK